MVGLLECASVTGISDGGVFPTDTIDGRGQTRVPLQLLPAPAVQP